MNDNRQKKSELLFLILAYNCFYELFEEVMNETFWCKGEWDRLNSNNLVIERLLS